MSRIGFGVFPCGWEAVVLRANKLDNRSRAGRPVKIGLRSGARWVGPQRGAPRGLNLFFAVPRTYVLGEYRSSLPGRVHGGTCRLSSAMVTAATRAALDRTDQRPVPTLDTSNAKGRGQECPRHTGLARGGGQDFVMGHARPSLQQEFFIFGIEHGFLRIETGKGFDGVP